MTVDYDELVERFMERTIVRDNHWLWTGARNKKTFHGLVTFKRRLVYLHRLMFCKKHDLCYHANFLACHKVECSIPYCWNPEHIYAGNHSTNTLDMIKVGHHKEALRTHCPYGHKYRSYPVKSGKRICLTCMRERDRNRKYITINKKKYYIPGTRTL